MGGLRKTFLLFLVSLCRAENSWSRDAVRSLPCPMAEDILPCVCSADEHYKMRMDCSQVESEDQLAEVFSAYLPFPTFRALIISGNPNVKRIRPGDLGPASFQHILIVDGALEVVEPEALSASYATATQVILSNNRLTEFPFEEVHLFEILSQLWLSGNDLELSFELRSDVLLELGFDANAFSEVPGIEFLGLKAVREIYLRGNGLRDIHTGTFTGLKNLSSVYLADNDLSDIPVGTIALVGGSAGVVELQNNNISNIAVGAITGLSDGKLFLHENSMVTLDEEVFRPLLETGVSVTIYGNPLGCGCDVAWLIPDASFMRQIHSDPPASCYDGELLQDLDPDIFASLC